MIISKKITKHKAFELTLLTKGWECIIDFSFGWTVMNQRDHAGIQFCFVLLGWKLIEFNFYDTRHVEE